MIIHWRNMKTIHQTLRINIISIQVQVLALKEIDHLLLEEEIEGNRFINRIG